jgi:hypothetical protein
MGEKRVNQIETGDVLRALSPIWLSKPETARRVRQRISTVLDWAKAAGYRTGDNPVEGVGRGLPRQSEKRGHFAAIPYAAVPQFVGKLPGVQASEFARLGFEFLDGGALVMTGKNFTGGKKTPATAASEPAQAHDPSVIVSQFPQTDARHGQHPVGPRRHRAIIRGRATLPELDPDVAATPAASGVA